jgi:hypothetical protein
MSTMNDFFEIPALPLPFFYYCHSQTKYHRPGSMKKAPSPRLNEKKAPLLSQTNCSAPNKSRSPTKSCPQIAAAHHQITTPFHKIHVQNQIAPKKSLLRCEHLQFWWL